VPVSPSPTRTPTSTPVPVSPSPTRTPTSTPVPISPSPTRTPASTPTPTPTRTPASTPTPTPTPAYTISIYGKFDAANPPIDAVAIWTSPTGNAGTWTRRGSALTSTCTIKYQDNVAPGTTIYYCIADGADETLVYFTQQAFSGTCPATYAANCIASVVVNSNTTRYLTSGDVFC
jgi:hypothetical protein